MGLKKICWQATNQRNTPRGKATAATQAMRSAFKMAPVPIRPVARCIHHEIAVVAANMGVMSQRNMMMKPTKGGKRRTPNSAEGR